MKTFDDLIFTKHPVAKTAKYYASDVVMMQRYQECKWAKLMFENGYGISVIFGDIFYSNVDNGTYEVAVLFDDTITYNTHITSDVLGWQTSEQITELMKQIQEIKIKQL